MALIDKKITDTDISTNGIISAPDKLTGTAAQNKALFDKLVKDIVKVKFNEIIDALVSITDGASGADQIGTTAIAGLTGATVQALLENLQALTAHLAGAETFTGIKTFNVSPIVPTPTTDMQVATKKYIDDGQLLDVKLAGTQTITGAKTFTTSPVVPAPTADTQASTKKYTDDKDATRKTYVDEGLALKADTATTYTKTNIQTPGQAAVHWGNLTNVPNFGDPHWKPPVANRAALPLTENGLEDTRTVLDDGDGKQAIYNCIAITGTVDQQWAKIADVDWMAEEATRVTQENARVSAESDRVTAETNRGTAESSRVVAESARGTAETSRSTSESNRVSAENTRTLNETSRGTAETSRVNTEALRVTAESGRNTAESGRVSAEATRQATITSIEQSIKIIWVTPVANYAAIGTTYATPSAYWTTQAIDTGCIWRRNANNTAWEYIGNISNSAFTNLLNEIARLGNYQLITNPTTGIAELWEV